MANVLWCDPGNHPYKADEPGSFSGTGVVYLPDGKQENRRQDVCAEHNPANPHRVTTVREILRDRTPEE